MAGRVETTVYREPWDADRRLSELRLNREGLLAVRAVAINESANATPYHPANAAGTLAYQHGSYALRARFVGKDWKPDRTDGVEAIRCDELKVRVAFANVDLACNDFHLPKPRSKKGAGAERASGADLFGDLPQFALAPKTGWALYYIMVDEKGAAELTRPVVANGTFTGAIERIYLHNGGDEADIDLSDDTDIAEGFDPQIARKK